MSQFWLKFDIHAIFHRQVQTAASVALTAALSAAAAGQSSGSLTKLSVPVPPSIQQSMLVGHKSATDIVHVSVSMPPPDPAALQAFVDSVSDPKSPTYRKWATPAQLGQLYGQPQATVQAIVNYLQSKGFKMTLVGDSRLNILADATVAQAESAFGTTINNYHALVANDYFRTDYYSFSTPLQFPSNLAPAVLTINGLDNVVKPHPLLKAHAAHSKPVASGKVRFNTDPLTPTQTRTLYGIAPLYTAGLQGQGHNVAISSWDGFKLTNVPLYYSHFGLPTPPAGVGSNITVVTIDGGSENNTPGGEADLDIQMVLGMAPLSSFRVYDGGGGITDVLTREQNDNIADIISESYGWDLDSGTATACHNIHLLMSGQGMTYNKATGDSGTILEPFAYGDYDPEIFLVGGTVANTDTTGNRLNETAWAFGGGGWATESVPFNVLPPWQKGKGVPTNINFRLVPDVALNAAGDSTGAYQFYLNGALSFDYDGTSFASPVFAGGFTIALQELVSLGGTSRLGRIADAVYAENGRSDVWFDVTQGFNGALPNGNASEAGPFWDFCTGWGAINFAAFAASVAVTPPTVFACTAISPYDNLALSPPVVEGTNPIGNASNLGANDGLGYSLTAVRELQVGKVATMQATFSTTLDPTQVTSLNVILEGTAAPQATISVYLLNQLTGKYVLLKSVSGTSISKLTNLAVPAASVANYVNTAGTVQALIRYLVPNDRIDQVNNFTFFLDELSVSGSQHLN